MSQTPVDKNGFYLTLTTQSGSSTKWLGGEGFSVGKSRDCQVAISDEALNPRHISVKIQKGEVYVEDLGSSNGTFINGKRLPSHQPTKLGSEDKIQLARPDLQMQVTPTFEEEEEDAFQQDIALLAAARLEATRIVEQAEIEAEQRVQEVYRRALQSQSDAETSYHSRLNAAYKDAENILHEAQARCHQLLGEARIKSNEIRRQSEGFVSDLRSRTQEECQSLLDQAQATSRELKQKSLAEADRILREKEEQLLEHSRNTLNERLARFEEDLEKEERRRLQNLEDELSQKRAGLESELKSVETELEKSRQILRTLIEKKANEQSILSDLGLAVEKQKRQSEETKVELVNMRGQVGDEAKRLEVLRAEVKALDSQRLKIDLQIRDTENKLERLQQETSTSSMRMREKLDAEKARLMSAEEQHRARLQNETAEKIHALEEQLINHLRERRERMAREMALMAETFIKEFRGQSSAIDYTELRDRLSRWFDGEVGVMMDAHAQSPMTGRSSRPGVAWVASGLMGLCLGVGVMFLVNSANEGHSEKAGSPMERRVAAASAARQADLEARKFNPAQTNEYRDNYVDNVIYLRKYTEIYLSDEFQRRYLRRLAPYLLRTWRIDETKAIAAMAVSSALVKSLIEKRLAIHPDFVNKGIDQMRDLEKESKFKLKKILGTNVRVESYLKFERRYFHKYVAWKAGGSN